MGNSSSSRRRNHHHRNNRPPPNRNPPPPPTTPHSPPPPQSFSFAANAPYPSPPPAPATGQSNTHLPSPWARFRLPLYVDHPKKINNNVNVHKDSIRVGVDDSDCYLVSFTLDAVVDGSITIFYYAKEGANGTFTPLYPEIYKPVKIPFCKGLGQKFYQPSGTGVDLGFFDMDDQSNPFSGDVFPLVICAESCLPSMDEQLVEPPLTTSRNSQITQAVLEKNSGSHFQAKVIKQILWADGVRYELRELYGIGNSNETTDKDQDLGKECIICMTDPNNTAVLPCRHMCLCSNCAKELRIQSDKCPICREPIEELIEIMVIEGESTPV